MAEWSKALPLTSSCLSPLPWFESQPGLGGGSHLARTRPNCLLDRQFPENLLFGQAKVSMKYFQFCLFGDNNQICS